MNPDELAERPHERLRRMLDRAELSNREVAERLEVAHETVSRWRSGQQEMRGRELRALIALLATRGIIVTEDWIRSGKAAPLSPMRRSGKVPGEDDVAEEKRGKRRGA